MLDLEIPQNFTLSLLKSSPQLLQVSHFKAQREILRDFKIKHII